MKVARAIFIGFGLLIGGQASAAQYIDGNKLFGECEAAGGFMEATCAGYIMGVTDALETEVCVPNEVNVRQIVDVVKLYLHDHPEKRHFGASSLVTVALKEKFPCN
jgi:Rap1a immunity proteins